MQWTLPIDLFPTGLFGHQALNGANPAADSATLCLIISIYSFKLIKFPSKIYQGINLVVLNSICYNSS